MMFNVHTDTPDMLQGYLVPDSFAGEARIRVTGDGAVVYEGACDQVIHDLIRIGRHETGLTSFTLDEGCVPGFQSFQDLSIYDAQTGVLIYRRNQPQHYLQKRVFHLETTLSVTMPYGRSLAPYFSYSFENAHLYGHETINQLFNLAHYPSIYFDGRIHIKPHQRYLDEHFFSFVSVADPFLALAMKIDCLGYEDQILQGQLEEREYATLLPLAGYFADIQINDPQAVRQHLKTAPKDILDGLASPMVGRLTGHTPGEGGARTDVAAALDMLSLFDMVVLSSNPAQSHQDLATELGIPYTAIQLPKIARETRVLAEVLRDLPVLELALENDLIVYKCLRDATQSVQSL